MVCTGTLYLMSRSRDPPSNLGQEILPSRALRYCNARLTSIPAACYPHPPPPLSQSHVIPSRHLFKALPTALSGNAIWECRTSLPPLSTITRALMTMPRAMTIERFVRAGVRRPAVHAWRLQASGNVLSRRHVPQPGHTVPISGAGRE